MNCRSNNYLFPVRQRDGPMRNGRTQQRKRQSMIVRESGESEPPHPRFFFFLSRQGRRLEEGGAPPARLRLSPRFVSDGHIKEPRRARRCRASSLRPAPPSRAPAGRSVPVAGGMGLIALARRPDGVGRGASLSAETLCHLCGRGVLDDRDVLLLRHSSEKTEALLWPGASATARRFWSRSITKQ
jgi:hypothetical protein